MRPSEAKPFPYIISRVINFRLSLLTTAGLDLSARSRAPLDLLLLPGFEGDCERGGGDGASNRDVGAGGEGEDAAGEEEPNEFGPQTREITKLRKLI